MTSGLSHYERLFGWQTREQQQPGFRRDLLPDPHEFYLRELGRLRVNAREWGQGLCVFHEDSTPSLGVNLRSGGYFCFSCQARGGDVVDFVRQRYGLDFISAVKQLGAWA